MKLCELTEGVGFNVMINDNDGQPKILYTGVFVKIHENGMAIIQVFEDPDLIVETICVKENNTNK